MKPLRRSISIALLASFLGAFSSPAHASLQLRKKGNAEKSSFGSPESKGKFDTFKRLLPFKPDHRVRITRPIKDKVKVLASRIREMDEKRWKALRSRMVEAARRKGVQPRAIREIATASQEKVASALEHTVGAFALLHPRAGKLVFSVLGVVALSTLLKLALPEAMALEGLHLYQPIWHDQGGDYFLVSHDDSLRDMGDEAAEDIVKGAGKVVKEGAEVAKDIGDEILEGLGELGEEIGDSIYDD